MLQTPKCPACEVSDTDRLRTVAQAAEQLGASGDTVRRLIAQAPIRAVALPSSVQRGEHGKGGTRIRSSEIQRFMNEECQPARGSWLRVQARPVLLLASGTPPRVDGRQRRLASKSQAGVPAL